MQSLRCSVDGCVLPHVARGYCENHYRSAIKWGNPISSFKYGERRKHPLYDRWRTATRCAEGVCEQWKDFWEFAKGVGEQPSPNCNLKRYDIRKPWSPDNFYWKELFYVSGDARKRQRVFRELNPIRCKGYSLKQNYGITIREYEALYSKQNGRCAVCGIEGKPFDSSNGKTNTLAVDHDHNTGKIRGLLCSSCNRGLGFMKEDPKILQAALLYLTI